MQDIKSWLKSADEPVAETCFLPGEVPEKPYVVFLDSVQFGGSDTQNLTCRHSLTVERYSDTNDDNTALEALFDAKALEYEKDKQWYKETECYLTVYSFQFFEKI